jgi:uncharacterized protein
LGETAALAAIVLTYSVVQSVFGVGLLVFGTPTLLLLGFSFEEVLAYLLPCSIVISTMQVAEGGFSLDPVRKLFLGFAAPAVFVGTAVALLLLDGKLDIRAIVGVVLLVTAAIRSFASIRFKLARIVRRSLRLLMTAMGLIHGLSNLGGGLLTVIVGSIYDGDKRETRRQIAFGYGVMGIIQLATLFATRSTSGWSLQTQLFLPFVAATTYLLLGRRVFAVTGETAYQFALTLLIATFGAILIASS